MKMLIDDLPVGFSLEKGMEGNDLQGHSTAL